MTRAAEKIGYEDTYTLRASSTPPEAKNNIDVLLMENHKELGVIAEPLNMGGGSNDNQQSATEAAEPVEGRDIVKELKVATSAYDAGKPIPRAVFLELVENALKAMAQKQEYNPQVARSIGLRLHLLTESQKKCLATKKEAIAKAIASYQIKKSRPMRDMFRKLRKKLGIGQQDPEAEIITLYQAIAIMTSTSDPDGELAQLRQQIVAIGIEEGRLAKEVKTSRK